MLLNKPREADIGLSQSITVGTICRQLGMAEQIYYRWRKEYGGLKVSQAKHLKDLVCENQRFKKGNTVFNLFIEPEWLIADDGTGQPEWQIFFILNRQFTGL